MFKIHGHRNEGGKWNYLSEDDMPENVYYSEDTENCSLDINGALNVFEFPGEFIIQLNDCLYKFTITKES